MLNTGECVVWFPESELNASESVLSVGYVECRLSEGKKELLNVHDCHRLFPPMI